MTPEITTGELHTALSRLHFAVIQEFPELSLDVRVCWAPGLNLYVEIETTERRKQLVVDRLMVGVLNGPYDYRFTVSYPTMAAEPYERVWVRGYVQLSRPKKEAA